MSWGGAACRYLSKRSHPWGCMLKSERRRLSEGK